MVCTKWQFGRISRLVVLVPVLAVAPVAAQDAEIDALIERLRGPEEAQVASAWALRELGPKAAPAVPALLERLVDERPRVRYLSALALTAIDPVQDRRALPVILETFQGETMYQHAADALVELGPRAKPVLPKLIAVLDDEESPKRSLTAEVLGRLGDPKAVPALARALRAEILPIPEEKRVFYAGLLNMGVVDENCPVRLHSARALGEIGPDAVPAVPALIETVRNEREDAGVQDTAVWALQRTGPGTVPALLELLGDENARIRLAGMKALSGHAPLSTSVVAALVAHLDDEDDAVRSGAARVLEQIRTKAENDHVTLWGALPHVYWREGLALLVFVVTWYLGAVRFPRRRPRGKVKQLLMIALTGSVPTVMTSVGVYHVLSRPWAQGFLPDAILVLLPFQLATVLSVALLCVLPAVVICQWKSGAREEYGCATTAPKP